jgi:dipeptidyl aminopeptidase/acylaminoacyl peptidase
MSVSNSFLTAPAVLLAALASILQIDPASAQSRLAAGGNSPAVAPAGRSANGPYSAPRTIEIDDNFRIRRVGDPQLSPDGRWVAYTVSQSSLEEGKSGTRLWMVPASGGEALPMTLEGGSASRPQWSPDGRYLSFMAARNGGKTQVWALDRRGGEAQALTSVAQGVGGYEWSPDGKRLLLSIRDPEEGAASASKPGASSAAPMSAAERKSAGPKPYVVDRLQFKRDGVGYLTDDRRTHLYVYELATGQLTQITSGPFDDSQGVWSPDGRRVAFVSNRTEEPDANQNSDIWVVAADNTDRGASALQITTNPGADGQPAWSPDGRWIAHTTVTQPELIWYATRHLAVAPADGSGQARVLTASLDRNVSAPRYSADGKQIYFRLEDSGEDHLARIEVANGKVTRPIAGLRSVGGFDFGPGGAIVALISDLDRPAEVYTLEKSGLKRITTVNDSLMAALRLAEAKNVQFRSKDGTEVEGFIHLPVDYRPGQRYPTLLRIHGGPVSQYRASFNFEAQLFAAQGYVVVMTNPRGSSGYGQEFSHALWADWGNKDFEDVMAGVDYAIAQGYSDPDRLGVGGWSYGGILTNFVITQTTRFKGAITGASEVFMPANYGHDHYQLQWEAEMGLPWDNLDAWLKISPFMRVANVTTPTLVMGGELDWNVPIQNSEQLYQALRRLGVPTQLVVYPGEPHGLRSAAFQKDRLERYLEWYDRWVKGVGGTRAN